MEIKTVPCLKQSDLPKHHLEKGGYFLSPTILPLQGLRVCLCSLRILKQAKIEFIAQLQGSCIKQGCNYLYWLVLRKSITNEDPL